MLPIFLCIYEQLDLCCWLCISAGMFKNNPHPPKKISQYRLHFYENGVETLILFFPLSSGQFSHSVVSDTSQPHELQHARPPCPSPTPWVFPLLLLLSRLSCVQLCVTPWTVAYQASPSMGFSRQEHWSGLPFPSPMHESGKWKWSRSVVSDS